MKSSELNLDKRSTSSMHEEEVKETDGDKFSVKDRFGQKVTN